MSEQNKIDGNVSVAKSGIALCRNAEMIDRFNALTVRVLYIGELAGKEHVGPTEWAEAISLARYALDRLGECGGAKVPDYVNGTKGASDVQQP